MVSLSSTTSRRYYPSAMKKVKSTTLANTKACCFLELMLIRHILQMDKDGVMREGLEQIHFDIIFDKFSLQSHVQVMGGLQELVPFIKFKFEQLKQLVIISDYASCFASHDAIPFVYHLNNYMIKKGIIFL
jgi:hypothetical protein